jgi:protein-tyrosine phosphatase
MNKHQAWILAGRTKHRVRDLLWEIYGRKIKVAELASPPRSILFICKGNICRSPFAHRMAEKMFDGVLRYKVAVDSAGLDVKMPCPSPLNAVEAAAGFGIDLEDHRSKQFQVEMYADFDMIVAMETSQYHVLAKNRAASYEKLFLLPFFENKNTRSGGYERYNVTDPYGKSLEKFNCCFQRIERCIAGIAQSINAL